MTNVHIGTRTRSVKLSSDWETPDDETLIKLALEALERPSDSIWFDPELWDTHTTLFHHAPDSDDTIAESNHRSILRDLSSAYARFPGAISEDSFGHWTYSRFNTIKIRVLYSNGEIHPAFTDAITIAIALRDNYPLYDDSDYSELESEYWDKAIMEEAPHSISRALEEREIELSESDLLLFNNDVIEYLYKNVAYQNSEFYISDEDMDSAISRAILLIGTVRPDETFQPLI